MIVHFVDPLSMSRKSPADIFKMAALSELLVNLKLCSRPLQPIVRIKTFEIISADHRVIYQR